MKKVKKTNKTMSVLIIAFSLILISLIGLTVAYFTDSKSYTGTLEFGNIELDITGGVDETTKVINFDIDRKTNNDPTWTGKIMPGDTIKMQVNIGLKSTSEPAYYVAVITDTKGAFENGIYFSDGTNVYVNDGTKTYLQSDSTKTALTGSNLKYVGALTKADKHNLTLNAVVSADYEIQGGKTEVELHIYAIQQANMDEYNETKQERSAYHQLMKKADYVINGVNSTSVADLKSVISNYANLTNFGIVKTRNVPAGYTKDDALTTTLNGKLDERSKDKISVYKKGDTEIVLASDYKIVAPTDCASMFASYAKMTSLDLSNFDTSNTTTMFGMFNGCSALTNLNIDNFKTSKVTTMSGMFNSCVGLTSLNLSSFDTSSVTNMSYMFNSCRNLEKLNLSSFKTSYVTALNVMFQSCEKLTEIKGLENWDTKNVTSMRNMFNKCYDLNSLNLSNFNTGKVTTMYGMFQHCQALTNLNVSNFNTSKVTDMSYMFNSCELLTTLNVSSFNTSKVLNMPAMFQSCRKLSGLDVSNFDTSNVTDMRNMFYYCTGLESLDISSFNTSKVTDMSQMFVHIGLDNSSTKMEIIGLANFDTSKVTKMRNMFSGSDQNTFAGKITNESLKGIKDWNVSKVTDMSYMFYGQGANLTELDLTRWDTSSCKTFNHMFADCIKLKKMDMTNWNVGSLRTCYNMFNDCQALESVGDISKWNTANLYDAGSIFARCYSLSGKLDLSGWNTTNLRGLEDTFLGCKNLTEIDLSGWNISNVIGNITDAIALTWPDAGSSSISSSIYTAHSEDANTLANLFKDCTSLTKIKVGSGWNTSKHDTTTFTNCGVSSVTSV